MRDDVGMMRHEAGLRGEPAPVLACAARIDHLLAVQEQQRKRLLGVLHVGKLADRRARLATGRDSVSRRERSDGTADRIDQQIAVALTPLVDAAKDGRRPLTRAADAHDVTTQLRIAVDHLGKHVVRRIE